MLIIKIVKNKLPFLVFFILFPMIIFSQDCDCSIVIGNFFKKIESNYIDNNKAINSKKYSNLKKNILAKAKTTTKDGCLNLGREITSFLNDKHIVFYINHSLDTTFKNYEYGDLATLDVNKYLVKKELLEGVWRSSANGLNYVIVKDKKDKNIYYAVLLDSQDIKWKKGSIKAVFYKKNQKQFDTKLIGNTFLEFATEANLSDNNKVLTISSITWERLGHITSKKNFAPPLVSFFTDSTNFIYLKINSFIGTKPIIDSLLEKNNYLLNKCPHLIIDIKFNNGGSVISYQSILPYLYTDPVRIESAYWLASDENIKKMKESRAKVKDTASERYKDYTSLINKMELNKGKKVVDPGSYIKYDSVKKYPTKVSVIIGKNGGSAAELFVLAALQSKKVTLFGENTAGAGDNLDAYPFDLGCDFYFVNIPISQRIQEFYKKPIDNIGIPPKIRISKDTDALSFVLKYYNIDYKF
jgi:hypothetical protein